MPIDIIAYIAGAAGILSIVSVILLIRSEVRLSKFLKGKKAETLEDSIISIDNELKTLLSFRKEIETYLKTVEFRLQRSIQGVHTLRFNPFKGTGEGGNQSFVTAFLNEQGDGVIISSMYSRDHISVFSKPIIHFKSTYELSAEEKEALETVTTPLKQQSPSSFAKV